MMSALRPSFRRRQSIAGFAVAAAAFAPTALLAHTGEGAHTGFLAGALHPWAGVDHLLAMALVGVWAVQRGGAVRWAGPLLFVLAMVAGSLIGAAAPVGLGLEPLIAFSVLALGLLVALQVQLPGVVVGTIIAAFALIHGHAHGAEIPAYAARSAFTAGFAMSTLSLHLIGAAAAFAALRLKHALWLRVAGFSAAAAGAVLMVA